MASDGPSISEVDLSKLPPDKQEEIKRILLFKRIETKEDLRLWLLYFLEVDLADCTVSRFATSNPLDMVWDIYQFWCDDKVEKPMSIYYIAGRSSQKTLSMACLQILLPLHFGISVVHFGGTSEQAQRAYDYFNKFVAKPYIKDYLKSDPTQKETVFILNEKEVKVEILSISPARVQGPHAPAVSLDELSSLAPDKLVAYDDLSGVPVASMEGHPWVKFGVSSRKGKFTIIETEYDKRHKTGIIFKFWTVFENTQACPVSIRTDERLEMYVNAIDNQAYMKPDYDVLEESAKAKFEKVNAYKGCFTCPLRAVCSGDLANQKSKCKTLRSVQTVIQEFKEAPSLEWFLSQKMSMTPSSEQTVFSKFKRETFLKTAREIWMIWKGQDPGREISNAELIDAMIEAGVERYAGIDHGTVHPFAVVVIFHDPGDRIYVMKVVKISGLDPNECVEVVRKLNVRLKLKKAYPDTARPDVNMLLRPVISLGTEFTKDPDWGHTLIRGKIAPTTGPTRFFGLMGEADLLADEMEKYHYILDSANRPTEEVLKEFDDAIDALSYAAQNKWKIKNVNIPDVDRPAILTPEGRRVVAEEKLKVQFQEIIKDHIAEKVGGNVMTQSKNKGAWWDF